jgi:glutamate dehydrogenase (NADP+)
VAFCQSFMTELQRHIGANTDVPAGDIGVGGREIGFLFGQYKRLCNEFTGVLTGKGLEYGGSLIRPEATGYGTVYFLTHVLAHHGLKLQGLTVAISGSGNVAQFACEKATQEGAKVITLSDSAGTILDNDGIDAEKLAWVKELKNKRRGRIAEYAHKFPGATFLPGKLPWENACDVALPCATQNELDLAAATQLASSGCKAVVEGANMPCTPEAVDLFHAKGVLFAPGKAANAGGVATSGLEMSQNSQRLAWTREEVDTRLRGIMLTIHTTCVKYGGAEKPVNYVTGANVGGFVKVADAMIAQGVV